MFNSALTIDQALSLRDRGALFIDARTPAEYSEATVPGAVNVPIFDNEERARVGRLYKEEGKAAARRLAVELVSPKIPELLRIVESSLEGKKPPVVVFCWRGGMRSRALTTFLELAGIPARQLAGGHKAFRARVIEFFAKGEWGRLLVLRGLTGVGKTRLLMNLKAEGYPVLDLEGVANHRGSAFGALGLAPQPGQKMFEALLWDEMRAFPSEGYALTEGESRHIGRLILPQRLYQALQSETTLWIKASLDHRVRVILDDYPALDSHKAAFLRPIQLLKPRLGTQAVEGLLKMLEAGDWESLARDLMVLYYDPLYEHTRPERLIEVDIEPEAEGYGRLKKAIGKVLSEKDNLELRAPRREETI
jgi:tRNA 2-selenouridine synthase